MKARTQAYSYAHLISVAEIASAIAIAKRTAGVDELRKLTQYAQSGESSAALYPPHQQWQHGGDAKRIGVPTGNPSSIWRALAAKVSGPHMSDKDAFNYPTAASTWHMLAADVYALAQQPVWSLLEATALRGLACRYSPELMGESAPPVPQQPKPAAVEALPVQPQAAAPAPVVAESASNAPLDAPQPVTTGDVAHAFDGLRRWNEKAWKDTLGSPPKWLEACIALRGERGKRETRWNPVLIGAALVHNGHAKANSIRARFQTKPQLQDWLEAWKTYEADNFDTP